MAKKEVIKINFNTLGKQMLGKPSIDGNVYYTKTDEYYAANPQNNESLLMKDPKLKAQFAVTYNSPANIRRVFFTYNKVLINYYTPYIIKGQKYNGGCWREVKLKGDTNLFKAGETIKFNVEHGSELAMQKAMNPDAVQEKSYTITGNILKSLIDPRAANIEEIYFDFSYLLSEDVIGFLSNMLQPGTTEQLQYQIMTAMLSNKSVITDELPKNLFIDAGGATFRNIKNIRNSFPRLKVIAMIPMLDTVIDKCSGLLQKKELMFNSTYTRNDLWMTDEKIKLILNQFGGTIIKYELISDLEKQPKKFNTQVGVYKFDRDILAPLFDSHVKKIEQSNIDSKYSSEEAEEELTAFELFYQSIGGNPKATDLVNVKTGEEKIANHVMEMLVVDSPTCNVIIQELKKVPKSRRDKYARRFGLTKFV